MSDALPRSCPDPTPALPPQTETGKCFPEGVRGKAARRKDRKRPQLAKHNHLPILAPTDSSCIQIQPGSFQDVKVVISKQVSQGLFLTLALCSTLAFRSRRRLTTSVLPWKQASVKAVFLLVSICAFMSEPMSKSSLTAAVWPFMAANINGEMPSLLPVLKTKQQICVSSPFLNADVTHFYSSMKAVARVYWNSRI